MRRVLLVFIDALGPRQLKRLSSRINEISHHRALDGILGYTSGALPTLLTGAEPSAHGRACLFSRATQTDALLTPLAWLGLLPRIVHERGKVRRYLSKQLKKRNGLTGYVADSHHGMYACGRNPIVASGHRGPGMLLAPP